MNWKQKLAKSMGGSVSNVRQVTTRHAYVNNKLLTATSENERKMCQKGATLTSAGLALEPSALEGISQTLMQMLAAAGTMMGTVVTGPEMLAGVAVGAGVYWTYQEWQKVGPIALVSSPASKLAANWKASQASSSVASTTFDILNEQLKELRKKKEEQETIHVGPGDENYEVVDTDGKVVYKGGGSGGNKKNDDDDDDLTPVAPENGNSNSGNIPDVSGEIKVIKSTQEGLGIIIDHLSGDMKAELNDAMIARIENILKNGGELTGPDSEFYLHEIEEANLMNQGLDYDTAHNAALEKYSVTEFDLYHPDVIEEMPEWFSPAWFEYWGLSQ